MNSWNLKRTRTTDIVSSHSTHSLLLFSLYIYFHRQPAILASLRDRLTPRLSTIDCLLSRVLSLSLSLSQFYSLRLYSPRRPYSTQPRHVRISRPTSCPSPSRTSRGQNQRWRSCSFGQDHQSEWTCQYVLTKEREREAYTRGKILINPT